MDDVSNIEYEYEEPEDIVLYVREQLARLGIDGAFRRLDATDSDADTIEVDGTTIGNEKYGFELPYDDDEDPERLGEALAWKTNSLVHAVGGDAYDTIEGETPWADDVPTAIEEVGGNTAIVLGNTTGAWIGRLSDPVDLWTDSVSLPVDTALVADQDQYGYRATRRPVETLEYREEECERDIVQVRLRLDYAVSNPDVGRLVEISGP